ncbi:MAG: hypothetical protein DMF06_15650 [Verrucomicrobia bacterium]|nr:MAG: hypothetical protein DMF06_15650 [Verrucomicrobiota bacterium]
MSVDSTRRDGALRGPQRDAKAYKKSKAPQRGVPPRLEREIFVLTPEEKRAVCFVLVVFVLGLATKSYRDSHPAPLPKPTTAAREQVTRKPPRPSRP